MEATPLEQLIDLHALKLKVSAVRSLLVEPKGSYSGNKLAYLRRLERTFDWVEDVLPKLDTDSTSITVLLEISNLLERIKGLLAPGADQPNWDEIRVHTDNLLQQVSMTGFRAETLTEFTNSLNDQVSVLKGSVEKKAAEVTILATAATEKIEQNSLKVAEFAENKHTEVNEKIRRIDVLAQFVSGKALSNEFSIQANAHRTAKRWWTGATVATAMITIAWLAVFFFQQYWIPREVIAGSISPVDLSLLTTKLLITLTLGLLTRWTSKRANHHLGEEARYRRLALNMDTLNSFVGSLDETNKNRVIAFVAAKILSDYPSNLADSEFEALSLGELITAISKKPVDILPKGH